MQRQYILMQLDIGSNIPGPDSAINIPNGIKVIDFSFQNTNDGSNIIINRFQLAKQIDESSIPILQAFHEGAMIDEMILHFLTADSQGILTEYYSITLEGGLFTSVEQSIVFTGNGWSHIETLDLVYDAVSFEHLSPNLEYGFSFIH